MQKRVTFTVDIFTTILKSTRRASIKDITDFLTEDEITFNGCSVK